MWHPIPGEIDDYIATPKQSMYRSLHTAVIGPEGRALEIQIRTRQMHEVAEFGVAAHWRYKEGDKGDAKLDAKVAWLRQLLEWQTEVKDAEEFVETLKSDVLEEMIYVFTPKGDIIELPAGATPLDFAYRVHTEIGHHTVRARVNEQQVRLDTKLQNGQMVEVVTSKTKSDRAAIGCVKISVTSRPRQPAKKSGSGSGARNAARTSRKARKHSNVSSAGSVWTCGPRISTSTFLDTLRSRTCLPRSVMARSHHS